MGSSQVISQCSLKARTIAAQPLDRLGGLEPAGALSAAEWVETAAARGDGFAFSKAHDEFANVFGGLQEAFLAGLRAFGAAAKEPALRGAVAFAQVGGQGFVVGPVVAQERVRKPLTVTASHSALSLPKGSLSRPNFAMSLRTCVESRRCFLISMPSSRMIPAVTLSKMACAASLSRSRRRQVSTVRGQGLWRSPVRPIPVRSGHPLRSGHPQAHGLAAAPHHAFHPVFQPPPDSRLELGVPPAAAFRVEKGLLCGFSGLFEVAHPCLYTPALLRARLFFG